MAAYEDFTIGANLLRRIAGASACQYHWPGTLFVISTQTLPSLQHTNRRILSSSSDGKRTECAQKIIYRLIFGSSYSW
jgi:hypothetical protein